MVDSSAVVQSGIARQLGLKPGVAGHGPRLLLLTQVPIGSPAIARSMLPSFLKLNTRIGKLILHAHADRRHVHDLELVAQDLLEGQVLVAARRAGSSRGRPSRRRRRAWP